MAGWVAGSVAGWVGGLVGGWVWVSGSLADVELHVAVVVVAVVVAPVVVTLRGTGF